MAVTDDARGDRAIVDELGTVPPREAAFLLNNWILLFSAVFVLFATMFPTLSEAVTGERLSLPLEVTVRDNGAGVPPDLVPYIFDPFVTTKRGGSGLGLALVAKIIGDHGGIIECDSAPRRTVFRILLPKVAHGDEGD